MHIKTFLKINLDVYFVFNEFVIVNMDITLYMGICFLNRGPSELSYYKVPSKGLALKEILNQFSCNLVL